MIRLFVGLRLVLQALASAWLAAEAGLAAKTRPVTSAKAWSASAARTTKALGSTKSWLTA